MAGVVQVRCQSTLDSPGDQEPRQSLAVAVMAGLESSLVVRLLTPDYQDFNAVVIIHQHGCGLHKAGLCGAECTSVHCHSIPKVSLRSACLGACDRNTYSNRPAVMPVMVLSVAAG